MNFKKSLSILSVPLLATTLLFNQSSVSFAASTSEHPPNVKTSISTSSVSLTWEKKGTKYKVYKDGKPIGDTKENTFLDTKVKPDELYKYLIAAYDGDKLVDVVRISTKAKSSNDRQSLKQENKDTVPDMTIESVAGSNYVTLNWPAIPDDDNTYELYRDGTLVAKVSGRQYIDQNVTPNTKYRYSVIGKKKLSEDEISNIKKEVQDKSAVSDEELRRLEHTFEAIKFVKTLDSNLLNNLDENHLKETNSISLSSTPYFSFRYGTFIPDYKVPNPFPWGSGTYFLGNNRSFDKLSTNSKTLQNIDVTFDQPSYSTYNQRTSVDSTTIVDGNNNEVWHGQAVCTPSNGAFDLYLMSPNSYGTDLKQFGAGADCGIPYYDWLSPDITYYYDAWIERDGDWRVQGSHDQAPSHEFYIYDRAIGDYTTIFQHPALRDSNGQVNFLALAPPYPSWSFDISG